MWRNFDLSVFAKIPKDSANFRLLSFWDVGQTNREEIFISWWCYYGASTDLCYKRHEPEIARITMKSSAKHQIDNARALTLFCLADLSSCWNIRWFLWWHRFLKFFACTQDFVTNILTVFHMFCWSVFEYLRVFLSMTFKASSSLFLMSHLRQVLILPFLP